MADIVLKDRQGVPQTYAGYGKVAFNTPDSGTVIFSEGDATENVPVELDLAAGDQTVEAQSGTLMKSAVIRKPTALTPENIAKDVNVAGVVGTFIGNGLENVEIIPDFSAGDQMVTAEGDTFIKSAIVRKPETLVPENIAKGIDVAGVTGTLSTGSMADYIRFFDYDGTQVYGWSEEDLEAATELPPYPVHDGLVCQGWNWTLEKIKSEAIPLDVGAMYTTDNGKTRIFISLPEGNTSPCLGLAIDGTADIDWGDGTEHDTLEGTSTGTVVFTSNHSYATAGDYVIEIEVTGSAYVPGANTTSYLLAESSGPSYAKSYLYRNSIKRVHLGDNIFIGRYSFYRCSSLEFITLPRSITTAYDYSFSACSALKAIIFPDSKFYTGGYAFDACHNLSVVSFSSGIYLLAASTFNSCISINELRIPSNLYDLRSSAFGQCRILKSAILKVSRQISITSGFSNSGLEKLTIIGDATSISGNYPFYSCGNLKEVVMETPSFTQFTYRVFSGANLLSKINIPNTLQNIADQAFQQCYSLPSFEFPASMVSIGANAFSQCYSLKKITFKSETPPTISNSNAFAELPTDCVIYVPNDSYLTATNYPSPSTYTYVVGGASA